MKNPVRLTLSQISRHVPSSYMTDVKADHYLLLKACRHYETRLSANLPLYLGFTHGSQICFHGQSVDLLLTHRIAYFGIWSAFVVPNYESQSAK